MKRVLFVRDHPYHTNAEMLLGVRRYARNNGWRVIACRIPRSDFRTLRLLAEEKNADGVILEATTFLEKSIRFRMPKVPTVFINGQDAFAGPSSSVVNHDSRGTGKRGAEVLAGLGFRHFLYAPYDLHGSCEWNDARERGFFGYLAACGLTFERLFPSEEFLRKVVADHHEVGLLAANDAMAAHVFALAKQAGVAIPRQLVVLGVDDLPSSKQLGLSSIRVDFDMGGYLAAKSLAAFFSGSKQPRHYQYGDFAVIHRKSTRHISMSSPILSKAIRLIREEACSGLSADRVAAVFPGSRRNAERYFREATGSSIHEEIEKVRHERILSLLSDASIPLTKMHLLAGYGTPQALRKAFRKQMKQSLSAYRKDRSRGQD